MAVAPGMKFCYLSRKKREGYGGASSGADAGVRFLLLLTSLSTRLAIPGLNRNSAFFGPGSSYSRLFLNQVDKLAILFDQEGCLREFCEFKSLFMGSPKSGFYALLK